MPEGYGRVKKITCSMCGKSYAPGAAGPFGTCPCLTEPGALERAWIWANNYIQRLLERIRP